MASSVCSGPPRSSRPRTATSAPRSTTRSASPRRSRSGSRRSSSSSRGLIFACTAATYAEGTVLFPEAGGSSSFARHAFNELVSFGAAWAQMLNYIITVAISAFFVPHYLSIFWAPLRTNPWDIIGGIVVVIVLVGINIIGVKEAARLNVFLAVLDFATQLLLVLLGFVLVFRPHILQANVHWGVAPTWSAFALAIPVAMIAYTGIETVSNLAEEARDPRRSIPRLDPARCDRGLRDLLHAAARRALGAAGVQGRGWALRDEARARSGPRRVRERPGARPCREPWARTVRFSLRAKVYVGILAATILFIATNAGVIGASRITYSMASHRQIPEVFRRLHQQAEDAVAGADPVRRGAADPLHAAGKRRLHRPDVRVRRDALVHDRTCGGDSVAPQAAGGRRAVSHPAELDDPGRRLAALRRLRRVRHRSGMARRRGSGRSDSLRGAWLARGRLRRLLPLPAPDPGAASR